MEHLDYVKNLGADLVLDYHAQPFNQQVKDVDVVLDLVGGKPKRQLQQIAQLIDAHQIEVTVEKTFELSAAGAAQEFSQHGHPYGKLVLQVTH